MIVNFQRGKGEVFHAGSCEWVAGLLRRDAMVEKVTGNVLDRYLGAKTHEAHADEPPRRSRALPNSAAVATSST